MSWRNERSSVHKARGTIRRMVLKVCTHGAVGLVLLTLAAFWGATLVCRTGYAQSEHTKTKAPAAAAKTTAPGAAATAPKPAGEPKPAAATANAGSANPSAKHSAAPAPSVPTARVPSQSSGAKVPGGDAPAGPVDAATYVVRLRDLESRVDELKEQIRRSHTRLSLLSDTILSGGVGGAEADIVFRNEMSNAFRVVSVLFVLDGAVMKKEQDDTGELAARRMIPVYDGTLTPGDHTLQVVVVFQGHGYGVFSYLRAHKYTTKHTHSFTVKEGKLARIEATAYEKGGVTTPIDQRPNVRFTEKIVGTLDDAPGGAK